MMMSGGGGTLASTRGSCPCKCFFNVLLHIYFFLTRANNGDDDDDDNKDDIDDDNNIDNDEQRGWDISEHEGQLPMWVFF